MERQKNISLFWFRRDLRLHDNAGLYEALRANCNVQPIFIFDTDILDDLENKNDRRVSFIHETITHLKFELNKLNSDLWVYYGKPFAIFNQLIDTHNISALHLNHDYEPYATQRDKEIADLCKKNTVNFKTYKDQVIFEKLEIAKSDNSPYTIFTPYMKKWKTSYNSTTIKNYNIFELTDRLNQFEEIQALIELKKLGFNKVDHQVPKLTIDKTKISEYHRTRDLLEIDGTTRLSVHLRFGTVSIRSLVQIASKHNETYLNELIWREFYMQILWNFPHIVTKNFKPKYDKLNWNNSNEDFEKWCNANTGYPIVDAAMNQLLSTGFMHNRARMIVASFLCKHLLIDWNKGEAFFAKHLTDYELSSNNGGWQWAASTGCDSVPYFRIFNPYTQTKKFDPNGYYINKWNGDKDLLPMIDHNEARKRCLNAFKNLQ